MKTSKRGLNQILAISFYITITIIITVILFFVIRNYKIEQAQIKVNCVQNVEIQILSVCYENNILKIEIKNKREIILGDFFLITYYFPGRSKVIPTPYQTNLQPYETKTILMPYYEELTKIKITPRIENQAYLCDAAAPEFKPIEKCEE